MIEYLGWIATAVFVGSYFCAPERLKQVQMLGALMWVAYGVLTHALPVIAANVLVMGAAALASWGARAKSGSTGFSQDEHPALPS